MLAGCWAVGEVVDAACGLRRRVCSVRRAVCGLGCAAWGVRRWVCGERRRLGVQCI